MHKVTYHSSADAWDGDRTPQLSKNPISPVCPSCSERQPPTGEASSCHPPGSNSAQAFLTGTNPGAPSTACRLNYEFAVRDSRLHWGKNTLLWILQNQQQLSFIFHMENTDGRHLILMKSYFKNPKNKTKKL